MYVKYIYVYDSPTYSYSETRGDVLLLERLLAIPSSPKNC